MHKHTNVGYFASLFDRGFSQLKLMSFCGSLFSIREKLTKKVDEEAKLMNKK